MSIYRDYRRLLLLEQNQTVDNSHHFKKHPFESHMNSINIWGDILSNLKDRELDGELDMEDIHSIKRFPLEEFMNSLYRGGSSLKVVDNQIDSLSNALEDIGPGSEEEIYYKHPISIKKIITREGTMSDDLDDLDSVNFDRKALPDGETTTVEFVAYFLSKDTDDKALFAGMFSNDGDSSYVKLKDGWQAKIDIETFKKVCHEYGISRETASSLSLEVIEEFGLTVGEVISKYIRSNKGDVTSVLNNARPDKPYQRGEGDQFHADEISEVEDESQLQDLDRLDDMIGQDQQLQDRKYAQQKASGFGTKNVAPKTTDVKISKDIDVDKMEDHEDPDREEALYNKYGKHWNTKHGEKLWADEDEETPVKKMKQFGKLKVQKKETVNGVTAPKKTKVATAEGIKKPKEIKNMPKALGTLNLVKQETKFEKAKEEDKKAKVAPGKATVPTERTKEKLLKEAFERNQMNAYMKGLQY